MDDMDEDEPLEDVENPEVLACTLWHFLNYWMSCYFHMDIVVFWKGRRSVPHSVIISHCSIHDVYFRVKWLTVIECTMCIWSPTYKWDVTGTFQQLSIVLAKLLNFRNTKYHLLFICQRLLLAFTAIQFGEKIHCVHKKTNPTQCTIEMSNPNTSQPNCVCLIMNIFATELPNFITKYYLLHKLFIFKYWQQNISVSNMALHTAVRHSGVQPTEHVRQCIC